jgi:subtilisin-like proprotein convertase family protein
MMSRRSRWQRWSFILLFMFACSLVSVQAAPQSADPGNTIKVLVHHTDPSIVQSMHTSGGTLLADYGSFSLWRISRISQKRFAADDGVVFPNLETIELRDTTINTQQATPTVPIHLRQIASTQSQFWMLQFVGPIKEEWLGNLAKQGIAIVAYLPNNAYVVWVDGTQMNWLQSQIGSNPTIQWEGAYHPAYRLAPALKTSQPATDGNGFVAVTVQIYAGGSPDTTIAQLRSFGGNILQPATQVLQLINISLNLPANQLATIANWDNVFNIEPWSPPTKQDEVQGQILAGNVNPTSPLAPSAPGYLAWLQSKGFPTDPASYPIIDVIDDGIDNGSATPIHADFYELGSASNPDRLIYNQNCTTDSSANGGGGHGNINAGIVGGYNATSGTLYEDGIGYQYGLGISPYGRLAGTKIFRNTGPFDISGCSNSYSGLVSASYAAGAAITSNSWGADAAGAYTAAAQAFDLLTRDASASTLGNQQMLHIFAAGNDGPNTTTVGSPGTAKNVLTVGATENVRDQGVADGCGETNANNANDIAGFSSRGPTSDLRAKPDLVAPGTHIQGPATQDAAYNGTGVCGGPANSTRSAANSYYPLGGQTLYTWSSGTSHSTPAVAGAASLLYNYYGRVLAPGQIPSPAMLKALLLNTPRYLDGSGTGGTLPGTSQGWGMVDLGSLFDGTPRMLVDQSVRLSATGQTHIQGINVLDSGKPLRVSLVWTDAPGATTGNSFVNNLNLEVIANGQTYRGNVFTGAFSSAGGTADSRNNVENVFLPAGITGSISVRVIAANLAGDGVPGVGNATDQDFALVISNAEAAQTTGLIQTAVSWSDATGGNNNAVIEPGETIALTVMLQNVGSASASGISGAIALTGIGATLISSTSAYPTIPVNGLAENTTTYLFTIDSNLACGNALSFTHTVSDLNGTLFTQDITFTTGIDGILSTINYASTDIPKAISASGTPQIESTLPIVSAQAVRKVVVRMNINHSYTEDLTVTLISPANTSTTLVARRGGDGNNFTNTVFDDDAASSITSAAAPFTGTFRPEQALSQLAGEPINGTWRLRVNDGFNLDGGSLTAWSLDISPRIWHCGITTTIGAGTNQTAFLNNTFATPLQIQIVDGNSAPVVGTSVTFTTPATGASAAFAGTGRVATAITDATGTATAPTLTANNTTGAYEVLVSLAGILTPVRFNLANVLDTPATLTAASGTPQTTSINTTFGASLKALVQNNTTQPLPGISVVFTVSGSGASALFTNNSRVYTATTDQNGIATSLPLVANAQVGSFQVTATSGILAPATFTLTNLLPDPVNITASAGISQTAVISTAFGTALQVTVRDNTLAPLSGMLVTFSAPTSGASGTFAGATTSISVLTNAQGIATAPIFSANTTKGSYLVNATVASATPATFNLTNTGIPLSILPTSLPAMQVGKNYDQQLTVSGGSGTGHTFSIQSGNLPAGITLTAAGRLFGTPTAEQTFNITIAVSDSHGNTGTQTYSLAIQPGMPPPSFTVYLPQLTR